MRLRWGSGVLSLVFSVGLGAATGACLVTAQPVYDTDVEPPAPQFEQVTDRPGYVWVNGHWAYIGGTWQWQAGSYQPERQGYVYRPAAWQRQGNRWHYNDGQWEAAQAAQPSNVIIRDHRGQQVQPQPQQPQQYQPPPGSVVVPSHTNP